MSGKRIAVIYAGGTIGMMRTSQGYAPAQRFGGMLAQMLAHAHASLPEYALYEYAAPIDSANAAPEDWQFIARDIAARYDDFDGFVVLHGTDTMAFTASALSFMLNGLRKPVILTGSQIPIGEARSDALQNLVTAMQFAASGQVNEVAICFNRLLLRGNRATKVSATRMQAFDSPNYPWLAEADIDIRFNTTALLPQAQQERFELPQYEPGRILSMRCIPGLPAQAVQAMLDLNPRALILQCYGAGNAPDRDPVLLDALAHAARRGMVLVASSQCLHGEVIQGAYATGSALARAGAIGAGDMTFEAIFTKLHHLFALGFPVDEVKSEFQRNRCGEMSSSS